MNNIPVMEPSEVLFHPTDPIYEEKIRQFQGCPTIATTKGGRLFTGWYSGGTCEPHMENYNLLVYSDDLGKTWSDPVFVIPSNKETCVQSLDIQLWTDPLGRLWVFWVENRTEVADSDQGFIVDGFRFGIDLIHSEWAMICEDPDAEELIFSTPRRLDDGFLRCKPLVLHNGTWLNFNYDQNCDRYGYSVSKDQGKTWTRKYGAKKLKTPFDEAMAVECMDKSIWMMARTVPEIGALAESFSFDGGETWTETRTSAFRDPSSRFYFTRTPKENLLLVKNDDAKNRKNMTAFLSCDDGKTWPYSLLLDGREGTSYPDGDFHDGKMYLVFDCGRCKEKEIILSVFTEEDIIQQKPPRNRLISKV